MSEQHLTLAVLATNSFVNTLSCMSLIGNFLSLSGSHIVHLYGNNIDSLAHNLFENRKHYLNKQKLTTSHPKLLKPSGANICTFAVNLGIIQKSKTISLGGQNLLCRCVLSETSFCSLRTCGRLLCEPAGWSMSATASSDKSFGTRIVTFLVNQIF